MQVIEIGGRCHCGGEVDLLYLIEPMVWQGRCFQCGEPYTVIGGGKGAVTC